MSSRADWLRVTRIKPGDLRIEHCGECHPRSVRNERISGGAIDFPGCLNVGKDHSLKGDRVRKRECRAMFAKK